MDDNSGALFGYLFGFVIAGAIAIWVATDANKRGMNGVGWAIGVFLFCIVFLPIYLIVRKPLLVQPQPYGYPPPPVAPPPPQGYASPPPPQGYAGPPPPQPYVSPQPPVQPPPPVQPQPPVQPHTPAQPGHAFCSNCGAQLAVGNKFCPSCGRPA